MSKLVFDIESDELLRGATVIWCIITKDITTGIVTTYTDIPKGIASLANANIIIGHNICQFDIPLIEKLYPDWSTKAKIRDTLCMSKLLSPSRHIHSLESYGLEFGRPKPSHEDWSKLSEEMLHRCREDVEINSMLYTLLVTECKGWDWIDAIELEQDFARDQARQELAGVDIDKGKLLDLVEYIDGRVGELEEVLYSILPLKVQDNGPVNKPFKKDRSYSAMATKYVELVNYEYTTSDNR